MKQKRHLLLWVGIIAVVAFSLALQSSPKFRDWTDHVKEFPIVREIVRSVLVETADAPAIPPSVPKEVGQPSQFPLLPDPSKTPGIVLPNVNERIVCTPGYAKSKRDVSQGMKNRVFELYGLTGNETKFEVDHLVSLSLGGGNNIDNLWPQAYTSEPWNAHDKDRLEFKLYRLVCTGKISLKEAQDAIRGNWIESYAKYIGERVRK